MVGAGLAGLSAAIYLARAQRDVLVIDGNRSMARWVPEVQNYLGFPEGISGEELLERGRAQAAAYGAVFLEEEVKSARRESRQGRDFVLEGQGVHRCRRLLLATGIFHRPPEINGVAECLGHSMFFCKDCDGVRVRNRTVAVYGWTNETVEYALGMLAYTPVVAIVTDGREPRWDGTRAQWIREYEVPVFTRVIERARHDGCEIRALVLAGGDEVEVDALFTTRGDVFYNELARSLGAELDEDGQIRVNESMATSVPGLYAAGCVTPANCQMIIAAGDGARAAQAINRDLFQESLATHRLRRLRERQLETTETEPAVRQEG